MKKTIIYFFIFIGHFSAANLFAKGINYYEDLMKINGNYLSDRKGFQYVNKIDFLSHFVKKAQEIEKDNSLDDEQKKYLVALAMFSSVPKRHSYELTEKEKKSHCQRVKNIREDFAETVEKENQKNKEMRSDAFRLLGDMYRFEGENCVGKSFIFRVPKYKKSLKNIEKALEINPQNMLAQISYGAYKYSAPKIGGGDIDVAIKSFRTAVEKGTKVERFFGYAWLAVALWKKNGDLKQAQSTLEKARDIFPKTKGLGYFQMKINNKK